MRTKETHLVVQSSRPGLGSGLFAGATIGVGERVVEYTGKKIPTKVADALKSRYLFEIDEAWTIDAEEETNTARYINHACEPNCEARIKRGKIFIYAIRPIERGEEITIDYGDEYFDEFIRPVGCKCTSRAHRS